MKKLLILLLVLVTLIPSSASAIDIRKEGTVQHGGTRMPSITRVSADYEDRVVTVGISRYTGNVHLRLRCEWYSCRLYYLHHIR